MPLTVNKERCTGCGLCAQACIYGAIRLDGKADIDSNSCIYCDACLGVCPVQAITRGETVGAAVTAPAPSTGYDKDPTPIMRDGKEVFLPDLKNEKIEEMIVDYQKENSIPLLEELVDQLRDAHIFCPGQAKDNKFIPAVLNDGKGKQFLPVFTSAKHVTSALPEMGKLFNMPFSDANALLTQIKVNGAAADGLIINPATNNLRFTPRLSQLIHAAEVERRKSGNKTRLTLGNVKPSDVHNEDVDKLVSDFNEEKDPEKKRNILNDILNRMYLRNVIIRGDLNEKNQLRHQVLVNKETGVRAVPVYLSSKNVAKPGENVSVVVLPFQKMVESFLALPLEVTDFMLRGTNHSLILKRPMVQQIFDINLKRMN